MAGKKKIIGVEAVEYHFEDRGVSGVRIHVAIPMGPAEGVGMRAESYFINGGDYSDYHLGEVDHIIFEPTRSGRARCVGVIYTSGKEEKT